MEYFAEEYVRFIDAYGMAYVLMSKRFESAEKFLTKALKVFKIWEPPKNKGIIRNSYRSSLSKGVPR